MKYCEECKVHVHQSLSNCPLCGSYLEKSAPCEKFAEYESRIESNVAYPQLVAKDESHQNFLRKKFLSILIIVIGVCVAIDILLTKDSLWSAYVACAGLATYLCVVTTIFKHRYFYSLLSTCAFVVSIATFVFDAIHSLDKVGNLSLVGISMSYVIPAFLLGIIIATDILIFCVQKKHRYYFITLFTSSLIALIPQLLVWIFRLPFVDWFSFALFFFSLLNVLIMAVVYWKRLKNEFRRKFHV